MARPLLMRWPSMSRTHVFKRVPLAVFSAVLSAGAGAQAQTEPDTLDEGIVTGTRASLAESVSRKRASEIVQDSIVAEDLGRFPDANVADSLSHITGITLQ